MPSSARPAAPVVHSRAAVCSAGTRVPSPSNRCDAEAAPSRRAHLPRAARGTRPARGELLGVLARARRERRNGARHPVSQWGADPVWVSRRPSHRARCSSSSTTCCASSGSRIVPAMRSRSSRRRPCPWRRFPGAPDGHRARLPAAVQRRAETVVRRRRDRPREHVLALRPAWPLPGTSPTASRVPPVGARAVRLRPAHARADDEREPHRCPPPAGRGQRPDRGPRATAGRGGSIAAPPPGIDDYAAWIRHAPRRRRPTPAA